MAKEFQDGTVFLGLVQDRLGPEKAVISNFWTILLRVKVEDGSKARQQADRIMDKMAEDPFTTSLPIKTAQWFPRLIALQEARNCHTGYHLLTPLTSPAL